MTGGATTSNAAVTPTLQRSAPSAVSIAVTEVSVRAENVANARPSAAETAETSAEAALGSWRQRSSPETASSATTTGWVSGIALQPREHETVGRRERRHQGRAEVLLPQDAPIRQIDRGDRSIVHPDERRRRRRR